MVPFLQLLCIPLPYDSATLTHLSSCSSLQCKVIVSDLYTFLILPQTVLEEPPAFPHYSNHVAIAASQKLSFQWAPPKEVTVSL